MECFKIEWKGPFSFADAQNSPEARESGIYLVYKLVKGSQILSYVGKSQQTGKRLSQHLQGFTHVLSDKEINKIAVFFGTIYCMEGSRTSANITPKQLGDIESFFINTIRPVGNSDATKKGYKGEHLMIINTSTGGKLKFRSFDKVMCNNPDFLKLLKENLAPKKK